MDKLTELKSKIEEFQAKSAFASDMKSFMAIVLKVIKDTKENVKDISDENQAKLDRVLAYLEQEHTNLLENVDVKIKNISQETTKLTNNVLEENKLIKKDVSNIKDTLETLKFLIDDISFDQEFENLAKKITELEKKIPKIEAETGETIVNKINEGDKLIKAEKVEGSDKFITQSNLDRAISILDQRTSYLLQKQTTTTTTGGLGTVTSVAMTVPTGLAISGSPITTSGTLALTLDTGYVIPLQTTLDGFVTEDQTVGQTIGDTTNRLTKLWATDLTVTNAIAGSITGNAGTVTNGVYTTGAGSVFEVPLTFSTGLTRSTNTITVNTTQNIAKLSNLTSNGFVKTSGGDGTLSIDTNTYLTGNQTITLSGDITGSGSTSITTTIANGAVDIAMLSATGTPSSSTYLRGDNTWATVSGLSWGSSISGTTADGVTLTMSKSANHGASALKLIADNTQTNQSALANLQLGTSGNVQGLLIQGTGSTTVGAVGTGKNHLSLWANVDTSNVNVLSIANGTAYTQTLRILANGAIIDDAGTNTLPSNYALNYDVGNIGASNRAILRAIFGNTQTNAGLSGVKFSVGTSGKVSGGYAQGTFSTDYDFTTGGVGWAAHGNTASQNTAAFLAGNETSFTRRWSVSTAGQTVQDLAIATVSANTVTLPNSVTSAKAGYEVTLGNTQANSPYGFLANVGTSAKVTGVMVKGTFGTATTGLTSAFTAWGNTAAQATRAIAIGNGTSFTETAFINTNGNATLATLTTTGNIELGHASDTTLARVSAGVVSIEGVNIVTTSSTDTLSNKTLTAPKFADLGFIADANGNELIILDTVASAVNEITYANAATGGNPNITASGGDANVGLDITPKGTGTVNIKGNSTQAGTLKLFENTTNGTNSVAIKTPASLAADYTLTLPVDDGTANQVLTTDGSGRLSWSTPGGATGIGWTLKEYSTASNATGITSGTIALATDIRYKIIVQADSRNTTQCIFYCKINGVTTANSYWQSCQGRSYDGTTAGSENQAFKDSQLNLNSNGNNTMMLDMDLTLLKWDNTNVRPTFSYNFAGTGAGATEAMSTIQGAGYQNTQTDVTSINFNCGATAKDWKMWIYKYATS